MISLVQLNSSYLSALAIGIASFLGTRHDLAVALVRNKQIECGGLLLHIGKPKSATIIKSYFFFKVVGASTHAFLVFSTYTYTKK